MAKFKLNPAYMPTADQPKAIDGRGEASNPGAIPDPARRDRDWKDVHDGRGDRAGPAPDAGDRPQQDPRRPALQRVPGVLPGQRGRVLRQLLRLLPAGACVPAQDLYIEKDSSINDEIDRLRHAATASPFARKDVIIVASVSCIYGIGSPQLYREQMQLFKVGDWIDRQEVFRKLVGMAVPPQRPEPLARGVPGQGEVLEIYLAYAESAYRIQLLATRSRGFSTSIRQPARSSM